MPRGRQLGAGGEEPFGNHGQHEIAWPRGPGGDERIEAEPADHGQDGFDVSMRECVQGWEHFGGGYEGLPLERAADQVDDGEWQIGEVSQGFMLDLAILSKGATEIILV